MVVRRPGDNPDMTTITAPPAGPSEPLILTADQGLLGELLPLAAAADVAPVTAHEPLAALASWSRAPVVLLGADLAARRRADRSGAAAARLCRVAPAGTRRPVPDGVAARRRAGGRARRIVGLAGRAARRPDRAADHARPGDRRHRRVRRCRCDDVRLRAGAGRGPRRRCGGDRLRSAGTRPRPDARARADRGLPVGRAVPDHRPAECPGVAGCAAAVGIARRAVVVRRCRSPDPPGLRRTGGALGRAAWARHRRRRPTRGPPTVSSTRSPPAATDCSS